MNFTSIAITSNKKNDKLNFFDDIITDDIRKGSHNVITKQKTVQLKIKEDVEVNVSYLESFPPHNEYSKLSILFLAGQSYTSSVWKDTNTMQIFSNMGYHCIAIDLPGTGKTTGDLITDQDKPIFMYKLLDELNLEKVAIIVASMSGLYVLPMLPERRVITIVAVAVSDTKIPEDRRKAITTPCLIVWGERDLSLGPLSQRHLRVLKETREVKVPNASHVCYESNPNDFQKIVLNWLAWICTLNSNKSINTAL
uniref:AB hydrolase-1 domain-containing protein n=1 Tax=Strongyloides stercoralis TaxID=6248 RepID=A0A0K0ENA3_STRER